MYPWRRILVPTDFSAASSWAFDDAVRVAGTTGAEIIVLHVRMTWTSNPNALRLPADAALYEYAERIELEKLKQHIAHSNAAIQQRMIVRNAPDPGAEVCRTAASEDVDLVVMSTHARHHVAHLILGSTTRAVLTGVHVPLLAIRYGVHLQGGMRRIVVPVHAGQESEAALKLAASVATWEGGEVDLVSVAPPAQRAEVERLLDDVIRRRLSNVRTSVTIVSGTSVERELVRYAQKRKADALFLNANAQPSPLKIDIIRNAPIPVMIVPDGEPSSSG